MRVFVSPGGQRGMLLYRVFQKRDTQNVKLLRNREIQRL